MRIGVFIAAGEVNFRSSLSSVARLIEEVSIDEIIIFYTTNSKENADRLKERLEKFSSEIKIDLKEIPGDKEPMILRLKALEEFKDKVDLALVSPAGASLASIAAMTFGKIAHVSFPFGLWSGLTYPYVLRQFQRVNVVPREVESRGVNASSFEGEINGGRIRKKIAEMVRKINERVKKPCLNCICENVEIRVEIWLTEADIKSTTILDVKVKDENSRIEEEVRRARERLRRIEDSLWKKKKISVGGIDSLVWLSGLLKTIPDREIKDRGKTFILDTSAILLGALNWSARGYKVRVPRCALYELIHKYEESVKPSRGKYNLVGLLGKALVDEIKHLGLLYPSNPDLCDKAMLQMDPYLLYNTYVVTADKGIKMMWGESPLEKLAELIMVKKTDEVDEYFPNRVYSLIYFFTLFKVIEEELSSLKGFLRDKYGEEESAGITFAGKLYADGIEIDKFVISL